jgi:hypothetical protein
LSTIFTYAKNEGAFDGVNPVDGVLIPRHAKEPGARREIRRRTAPRRRRRVAIGRSPKTARLGSRRHLPGDTARQPLVSRG